MGLIDTPPGHIPQGSIRFHGDDLLTMPDEQLRKIRARAWRWSPRTR